MRLNKAKQIIQDRDMRIRVAKKVKEWKNKKPRGKISHDKKRKKKLEWIVNDI